jgi:hypothetical protein
MPIFFKKIIISHLRIPSSFLHTFFSDFLFFSFKNSNLQTVIGHLGLFEHILQNLKLNVSNGQNL